MSYEAEERYYPKGSQKNYYIIDFHVITEIIEHFFYSFFTNNKSI